MSGPVPVAHCNILFKIKKKTVKIYSVVKSVKLLLVLSIQLLGFIEYPQVCLTLLY